MSQNEAPALTIIVIYSVYITCSVRLCTGMLVLTAGFTVVLKRCQGKLHC